MDNVSAKAADFDFLAPLRRAQRYYTVRGVVLALLWALSAGLVAYKLAPFVALSSDTTAFFIAAPVLVVGLALAFGNSPHLADLARRADRLYSLGERLSTAAGLQPAATSMHSAIESALRRDAARYAAEIRPYRLVPPIGAATIIAAALMVAAAGLFALLPGPPATRVAIERPVAVAPAVDAAERSKNLQDIADILSADAEKRDSGYLGEVADAVSKLAEARNLSPEDATQQLTGLLDNARLAYGRNVPNWLLQDATAPGNKYGLPRDGDFGNLARRATAANVPDPKAGGGEEMVPELLSEQGLQHEAVPAPLPGQISVAPQDNSDLALSQQNVGGDPSTGDQVSGRAKSGPPGGAPPALRDTDPGSRNLDANSAILAGGATQSGQGASRTAGNGTQDLNDPNRIAATPIKPAEEVMLPPGEYKQGKRIRVQVTPDTTTAATVDSQGHTIAAPGPAEQTPVIRDLPSVRDQAIFSRFFTHDEAGGGA